VIKNLSRQEDFKIRLNVETTVEKLKTILKESYPDNPQPSSQRIIFAGKELQDTQTTLRDIFLRFHCDLSIPQTFHLVIPPKSPAPPRIIPQHNTQFNNDGLRNVQIPRVFVVGGGLPNQVQIGGGLPNQAQIGPQAQPAGQSYLNWTLLLKLLVVVYIVSQGGGTGRMVALILGAILIYLYQVGIIKFNLGILRPRQPTPPPVVEGGEGVQPVPQVRPVPGDGVREGEENNTATEARPADPQQRTGILREIENLVMPFVCSLIPSWNPEHQAALNPAVHPHQQ